MNRSPYAIETIKSIFFGNKELCFSIPEKLISSLVKSIGKNEEPVKRLDFLQSILKVGKTPLRFLSFLFFLFFFFVDFSLFSPETCHLYG